MVYIEVHMDSELRKCARCRSDKLLTKYFSLNVRGQYFKTCDKCRSKHKCDQCNYTTPTITKLKQHISAVHDKLKPYKCEQCEESFSESGNLKQHIKSVHDKIKDHKCDRCNYSSSESGKLKKHIRAVHLYHHIKIFIQYHILPLPLIYHVSQQPSLLKPRRMYSFYHIFY